mmetsp:Transcript_74199/g.143632  ORF Transcript_74199/g.143632 Transcript_74199/m.143632 type:complete len:91 (-) Transcript_74199:1009-1281(-)
MNVDVQAVALHSNAPKPSLDIPHRCVTLAAQTRKCARDGEPKNCRFSGAIHLYGYIGHLQNSITYCAQQQPTGAHQRNSKPKNIGPRKKE